MEVGSVYAFSPRCQLHPCGYFKSVSGRKAPLINELQLTVLKKEKKNRNPEGRRVEQSTLAEKRISLIRQAATLTAMHTYTHRGGCEVTVYS